MEQQNDKDVVNNYDSDSESNGMMLDDNCDIPENKIDSQDKRSKVGGKFFVQEFTSKEEDPEASTLEKIKLPKRMYAIIHSYIGHKYCGNQK